MSKDKRLRKIVIEKLYPKNENIMKKSTRSNAPTQSTPNQPKNFSKAIESFFENFQAECAIIYEPIKVKDYRPLKRSLEEELNFVYRHDKRLNFKTQESQSLTNSRFTRNSSAIIWSGVQSQNNSRMHTQNSNCQSRQRQNKPMYTDVGKQTMYKSKSMIFCKIPVPQTQPLAKFNSIQFDRGLSRQSSQLIRVQKVKSIYQKLPPNLIKQDNQYMTNSKYIPSKYAPKNAPMKLQQKPQRVDRIKRIQSLKNLNENGIRKYSYKRDL